MARDFSEAGVRQMRRSPPTELLQKPTVSDSPSFLALLSFSSIHGRPVRSTALLGLLALWLVSCECSEDKPYTPFEVATELPSPARSPKELSPEPAAPQTPKLEVLRLPPQTQVWQTSEQRLDAPPGFILDQVLRLHSAGAPRPALFAWCQAKDPQKSPVLFAARGAQDQLEPLVATPSFLPLGADCETKVDFESSGQESLVIRLRSACTTPRMPGTPHGATLIVDLKEGRTFGVRHLDPAPGEKLELRVDAADADGDGRDDRTLKFSIAGPEGQRADLDFTWLMRPAGPSRRSDTPTQAFVERAQRLMIAGVRKKERGTVRAEVDALRRAFGAVCAESKTAKISLLDGTGLPCPGLDKAFPLLTKATVSAHLGLGEKDRALGEVLRADWFPPGQALSPEVARGLLGEVARAEPTLARTLSPRVAGDGWLSFDQAGRLFWHDATGDRLLDPPAPLEEESSNEPPAFRLPDPRIGPAGTRVNGILPSCDRSEVQVALSEGGGRPPRLLPIRLLAPRPGGCAHFGGPPLEARVLGWDSGLPRFIVVGEVLNLGPPDAPPQSPVAFHTPLGLAITRGRGHLQFWSTEQTSVEHNCALDSRVRRAACAHQGVVRLYELKGEP